MKHIIVPNSPRRDPAARARELYSRLIRRGRHVLLDDGREITNSQPNRRLTAADVLITVPRPKRCEKTT